MSEPVLRSHYNFDRQETVYTLTVPDDFVKKTTKEEMFSWYMELLLSLMANYDNSEIVH